MRDVMKEKIKQYILTQLNQETVALPLYDKKTWKKCIHAFKKGYKEYHNPAMLCRLVAETCTAKPCKIKYIKFVNIKYTKYLNWCKAMHLNKRDFESQVAYANASLSMPQKLKASSKHLLNIQSLSFLPLYRSNNYQVSSIYLASAKNGLEDCLNANVHSSLQYKFFPIAFPIYAFNDVCNKLKLVEQSNRLPKDWDDFVHEYVYDNAEGGGDAVYLLPVLISLRDKCETIPLSLFIDNDDAKSEICKNLSMIQVILRDVVPGITVDNNGIISFSDVEYIVNSDDDSPSEQPASETQEEEVTRPYKTFSLLQDAIAELCVLIAQQNINVTIIASYSDSVGKFNYSPNSKKSILYNDLYSFFSQDKFLNDKFCCFYDSDTHTNRFGFQITHQNDKIDIVHLTNDAIESIYHPHGREPHGFNRADDSPHIF